LVTSPSGRRIGRARAAVTALAVVLGLATLPAVRDGLWATLFLADFVAGPKPTLYKRLTEAPAVTGHCLTGDGPGIPYDLYTPPGRPRAAAVLTHGMAHRGRRDPRVRQQAERLARAGYLVMAPDLARMQAYGLSFDDVEAAARCVRFVASQPSVEGLTVGAVAPSFGAGPVLIALSRPEVRDLCDFALIFGGYYDLKRTLEYTLTGAYNAEGYRGRIDPIVNRHNRWKFLHGNVGLLPESDSRSLLAHIAAERIEDPGRADGHLVARLEPVERLVLEFMANETPARFDSLYDCLPQPLTAWVDTFSLDHYSDQIHSRLLIVHSDADDKVSFTEGLSLSRNLPAAPPPRLAVVSVFQHMDLNLSWSSASAVIGQGLPDALTLWRLAYDLMRQRR